MIINRAENNSGLRWALQDGLWKLNCKKPYELLPTLVSYTLQNCVKQLKANVLVCRSERDHMSPENAMQERRLFDALDCPKEYIEFTAEDCAEEHCQAGAFALSTQRRLDWLDEVFNNTI